MWLHCNYHIGVILEGKIFTNWALPVFKSKIFTNHHRLLRVPIEINISRVNFHGLNSIHEIFILENNLLYGIDKASMVDD